MFSPKYEIIHNYFDMDKKEKEIKKCRDYIRMNTSLKLYRSREFSLNTYRKPNIYDLQTRLERPTYLHPIEIERFYPYGRSIYNKDIINDDKPVIFNLIKS